MDYIQETVDSQLNFILGFLLLTCRAYFQRTILMNVYDTASRNVYS